MKKKYFKLKDEHKKNTQFIVLPRGFGLKYCMVDNLQRDIEKIERYCRAIPEVHDDFIGEFWKGITIDRIRAVKYSLKCFMEHLEGGDNE